MKLRKDNSMMTAVAALSGMAAGAVIAALFAKQSGKDTRSYLLDLINDLTGQSAQKEIEIKDHLVEDVRMHTKEIADQLIGSTGENVDIVKQTLKQTGPKSRQIPQEEI